MTRPWVSRTRLLPECRELYPAVFTLKIYTGPSLSETSQIHACGNPNLCPLVHTERKRERVSEGEREGERVRERERRRRRERRGGERETGREGEGEARVRRGEKVRCERGESAWGAALVREIRRAWEERESLRRGVWGSSTGWVGAR